MTSIFLSIILVFMAFSAESWKLPKSSAGFLIIHRGSSAISHQFLNILVSDNDLKAKHNVEIDHYLELRQSVWEVNISNSIVDTRPRAGENVKFDLMQIREFSVKFWAPSSERFTCLKPEGKYLEAQRVGLSKQNKPVLKSCHVFLFFNLRELSQFSSPKTSYIGDFQQAVDFW